MKMQKFSNQKGRTLIKIMFWLHVYFSFSLKSPHRSLEIAALLGWAYILCTIQCENTYISSEKGETSAQLTGILPEISEFIWILLITNCWGILTQNTIFS